MVPSTKGQNLGEKDRWQREISEFIDILKLDETSEKNP